MHNSRVNKNTQPVWARGNPSRKRSAPEQREQEIDSSKLYSVVESTHQSGFTLPTKQFDTPLFLEIDPLTGEEVSKECPKVLEQDVFPASPSYSEILPDHNPSGYGRAVGNRHHFRYSPYSSAPPSFPANSEEEEDEAYDRVVSKSCVSALGNIIGRRIARAMVDLVGVEPNPGPKVKSKSVPKAQKKTAKVRKGKVSVLAPPQGMRYGSDIAKYMRVLCDPWSMLPVRLGGEMMQPSSICTLSYKNIQTLSTLGNLSLVFYPRAINPLLASGTVSAPYTYGAAQFSNGATLSSVALGGRIISAGVRITSAASSQNDNGILVMGCLPRETVVTLPGGTGLTQGGQVYTASTAGTQGYNEFTQYSQCEVFPLKDGASCVYRPTDPVDFTFRDTIIASPSTYIVDEPLSPFLVAGVTGGTANAPVMVEYTVHIEYTSSEAFTGIADLEIGVPTMNQLISAAKGIFGADQNTATPGGKSTFARGVDKLRNFQKEYLGPALNLAKDVAPYAGAAYRLATAFGSSM